MISPVVGLTHKTDRCHSIVLPVDALLEQYKTAESPVVKHFDITFIQHSLTRLDSYERGQLFPKFLPGIGTDLSPLSSLCNIIFRLLHDIKIPPRGSKEDDSYRTALGLTDPRDTALLATWLGKLILFRAQMGTSSQIPPGLNETDVNFLNPHKSDTWNPSSPKGLNLAETRIKAAAFLSSGAFTDEERFLPALYAASSSDFRVSELGEDMLKRSSASLEDKDLVRKLFDNLKVLATPYRTRILGLLSKSELSTSFTDDILAIVKQNVVVKEDPSGAASSSKGLELAKLHRALFGYINWVARIGPAKTDFKKMGAPVIDVLREYIEGQGWPVPTHQLSLDETTLRLGAYETIGLLAKASSLSGTACLSLAGWLFRSLSEDKTPDVVVNIEGALSSLAGCFKPPYSVGMEPQLRAILMAHMSLDEHEPPAVRSTRYAATKWANQCLLFSDVSARWINILAIAARRDERNDVVEEGRRGLDPWTYRANDISSTDLPDWLRMVQDFFTRPISHLGSESLLGDLPDSLPTAQGFVKGSMDVDSTSPFLNFPGDSLAAFPVALEYCKQIMFLTVLEKWQVEPGWERELDTLIHSDLQTRVAIREYIACQENRSGGLLCLLRASLEGMTMENTKIAEQCAQTFVDVAPFTPRATLAALVDRWPVLLPLIRSDNEGLRVLGANALGILAAHPQNGEDGIKKAEAMLIDAAKSGVNTNAAEGAFLGLAHLCSRVVYYQTPLENHPGAGLGNVIPRLTSVGSSTASTRNTLLETYAQLWTAGIAQITPGEDETMWIGNISKEYIDPLMVHARKGDEKAIRALGRLTLACDNDEVVGLILEKLYTLHEIKQVDAQFAVGEAITAAVAGWDAKFVQLTIDVDAGEQGLRRMRPGHFVSVLEKLLADTKNTKPSLLKASGIWLFCLIQHCSHLEEVQSRLRQCQVAFIRLLGARDELVQETASRGLSLVYEKGDAALKKDLMRDLVATFTGTGTQLKVDEETELFEAGALPTGEGKSIVSYKDILNLANEVGDQSLVYKFMSLATNAATWSTRSAFGRFGLSKIMSEWAVDPVLYPKLYRYRFDPNPNVQRSMDDIWKSLVKDSGAVIDTHFDAIMKDLLKSMTAKEWRVRQASCSAISDLVSGRPFTQYEAYYKDLWATAAKVLDDVKQTVRNAALNLCLSLSNTLVRQLEESSSPSTSGAMMAASLPFLLSDKALESGVEEVKAISIITILGIAKNAGKLLNPYVPTLVVQLLGSLSTTESDAINYHYQRAKEGTREKIDQLRVDYVSKSPITEAIESCLRTVDDDVMKELSPRLEEAIKTSLGLSSKIGCARVLSTLAVRHATHFRPYSSRFLELMQKHTLERNDEASKNYAQSAAYIIRVCPDDAKQRYADRLVELYLGSEDENRRQKVADAVLVLSKTSPDHFNALESQLLPLAFLAKHDKDEYIQKQFEAVWSQHAGSSLTVVRWISEIVKLADAFLNTAQWALKHAAALATASAVASVVSASDLSGRADIVTLERVWHAYEPSLALKTFENKEKLLDPFPDFVRKAKEWWTKDAQFGQKLSKIAIREAKRNNDEYRRHAFRCLGRFAAVRDDLNMLPEIAHIVHPYMDLASDDPDAMDVETRPNAKRARGVDLKTQTAWAAIEAVAKGYNRANMDANPLAELREIVVALEENAAAKGKPNLESPYIANTRFDEIRRAYWYECAAELLENAGKSKAEVGGEGLEILKWFLATLDLDRADSGVEHQRLARAKAVLATLKLWKQTQAKGNEMAETKEVVRGAVKKALQEERSLQVREQWKECLPLLD